MRSDWRGDARKTSAPNRAMSNRDAEAAIISIAQHARPKPIGQIDDSRAQLRIRSILVVMKLSSKRWSMRPIVLRVFPNESGPPPGSFVERKDRLDGARRHARAAVDALVGVNIKHVGRLIVPFVLTRVDAVHRTDVHAGGVLRSNARLADDIRH